MSTVQIRRGSKVVDIFGHEGIVVDIDLMGCTPDELSNENHGSITVWQSQRTEYGADNCEHYSYLGWESLITVLEY